MAVDGLRLTRGVHAEVCTTAELEAEFSTEAGIERERSSQHQTIRVNAQSTRDSK